MITPPGVAWELHDRASAVRVARTRYRVLALVLLAAAVVVGVHASRTAAMVLGGFAAVMFAVGERFAGRYDGIAQTLMALNLAVPDVKELRSDGFELARLLRHPDIRCRLAELRSDVDEPIVMARPGMSLADVAVRVGDRSSCVVAVMDPKAGRGVRFTRLDAGT